LAKVFILKNVQSGLNYVDGRSWHWKFFIQL